MSHFHADTGIMRRGERGNDELRMEDLGDSAANKSPIEQVSYEFDPATGPTGHYEARNLNTSKMKHHPTLSRKRARVSDLAVAGHTSTPVPILPKPPQTGQFLSQPARPDPPQSRPSLPDSQRFAPVAYTFTQEQYNEMASRIYKSGYRDGYQECGRRAAVLKLEKLNNKRQVLQQQLSPGPVGLDGHPRPTVPAYTQKYNYQYYSAAVPAPAPQFSNGFAPMEMTVEPSEPRNSLDRTSMGRKGVPGHENDGPIGGNGGFGASK